MIECFGLERFLQEAGISSVNGDQFGRLWWAVTGKLGSRWQHIGA
jgi:hypothetical protein